MLVDFTLPEGFRGLRREPFSDAHGSPAGFGRRTVIFGRNGTGKSTLSEALRSGAVGLVQVRCRSEQDGRVVSGPLPGRGLDAVHVFNRFYVDASLRSFLDGDGSSEGIVKLGEASVSLEDELLSLRASLARFRRGGQRLARFYSSVSAQRSAAVESVKVLVIERLQTADGAIYNPTRFNITRAERLLTAPAVEQLDTNALESLLLTARTLTLPPLAPQAPPELDLARIAGAVGELMRREVRSVVIEALRDSPKEAAWVEVGMDLHEVGSACRFCQVGVVSQETLDTYARHFDQTLKELRKDLTRASARLVELDGELETWLLKLPTVENLLPHLREDFTTVLGAVVSDATAIKVWMALAKDLIDTRLADPYGAMEVIPEWLADAPSWEPASLVEVLARHNDAIASQQARQVAACKAVEQQCAIPYRDAYEASRESMRVADAIRPRIAGKCGDLESRIAVLEASRADTQVMAQLLNADLQQLFGHVHLSVTVDDSHTGYRVLRGGNLATTLSEGERNAIALVYFLRTLEAEGVTLVDDLVVIDDPVTSLDREAMFAAHALISERTKTARQLVVLTHDFEFLRLAVNQFTSQLRKAEEEAQSDRPPAVPRVAFLEMRAHAESDGERLSFVRPISTRVIRSQSEYHYLFWRVGQAVESQADPEAPLLGNAGRRLLEGFVGFKAPSATDFAGKVNRAAAEGRVASELSERVRRFANGMSHRMEASPTTPMQFLAVEEELRSIMLFIKACDESHFRDMCSATGLVELADLAVA